MSEMASGVTTPWRRTVDQVELGLTAWARSLLGDDRAVVDSVRMADSGFANDTAFFRLGGQSLVARLAPAPGSPYPTFPTFDLGMQRDVIELVRSRTTVPVPEIYHLELSDQWVGVPFMVTRLVEGEVPSDNPPYLLDPSGWFMQGTPEQWRTFEISTIEVMARVHRIDDGDTTSFLRSGFPGETAVSRLLAFCRFYYDWAREDYRVPVLEEAIAKLTGTLPRNEASVLNWGDARPGNIIYREFRPAAVLDWEMAGLGPPEVDVAWTTFFQKFWAGMAEQYGLPPVPALFATEDTKQLYEELSGRAIDDLAWYEALAGLRFGIILLRMNLRSRAFGSQTDWADPDDMMMFAPLLRRLLEEI